MILMTFLGKHVQQTGIPVRPREMKIRGRINFDPNRGSALLRDSLSGFNSKYPKPITDEE